MVVIRETEAVVERLTVSAYTIPTEAPEADGTLGWNSTTLVLVELRGGGLTGIGYTYATAATARFIDDVLKPCVEGAEAMAVSEIWNRMVRAVRNQGRPGISSMAISAVDHALWDLKAKLLELPLVTLLGQVRRSFPIYGSGGFTTWNVSKLQAQMAGWVEAGIPRVKMKVGGHVETAVERVAAAREAIGPEAELYVDANSAFSRKGALRFMERASEYGVGWMEQPIAPEDLDGLRFLRDRAPAGIEIADGEYGDDLPYFRRMLEAGAVDVLMADATRCGGVTGFARAAALSEAFRVPVSSHCAPLLHAHLGCALSQVRHGEYFHDHVRIEEMLFDGVPKPVNGELAPDLSRPGIGVAFKQTDAARFQVYGKEVV